MEKSPLLFVVLNPHSMLIVTGNGLQELAGNATLLYYLTEEGTEGQASFSR